MHKSVTFYTREEKWYTVFLIMEGIIIKFRLRRWKHGKKCHITVECYVSENHLLQRKQMRVLYQLLNKNF